MQVLWSDPLFEGFDPREIVALNNELQGFESSATDTLIADEMETIDHSLSEDLVSIGMCAATSARAASLQCCECCLYRLNY